MNNKNAPGERSDPPPELAALREAVRRMARTSVLVVGDAMLDRYLHGEVVRLSPEAPIPILSVRRESALPGGAGCVMRNLTALGAAVAFVSVVGDDLAGSELTGLVGELPGVEPWLLVGTDRRTMEKTRFIADGGPYGHPLLRADRDETRPLDERDAARMVRIAVEAMAAISVVVLADHRKGTLAGDVPARLISAARACGRPVVADLRGRDYGRYAGADVVMTTRRQLARSLDVAPENEQGFVDAAEELRRTHGFGAVLVTSAEAGITLVEEDLWQHFPVDAPEVPELAGAADTVTAVLAAGIAARLGLPVATRLATIGAGIALRRTGSAVVRGADLIAALSPQGSALRKVVGAEALADRAERWHRQGWRTGLAVGGFDPLMPAQRAMIERARARCDRLTVLVFDDATVQRRMGPDRPLEPQAVRAARVAELGWVNRVVVGDERDASALLASLRPLVLAGADPAEDADLVGGYRGMLVG